MACPLELGHFLYVDLVGQAVLPAAGFQAAIIGQSELRSDAPAEAGAQTEIRPTNTRSKAAIQGRANGQSPEHLAEPLTWYV